MSELMPGWLGQDVAKREFDKLGGTTYKEHIFGRPLQTAGKMSLYDFEKKLLGDFPPNYAQEIGDCAIANTMITMEDGSLKPIQDVIVGDVVITHTKEPRKVLRTIHKEYSGDLVTLNNNVTFTKDHQFLKDDVVDWVAIADLKIGDILISQCGNITVETHEVSNHSCDVYCLEVEDYHSFIANGYVVHNCTSFGGKNALEALQAVEIALDGEAEKWRPVYPPFIYGAERVWIGGGSIWGDGGVGIWVVKALQKYGNLFSDEPGVPKYSGSIAKQWGKSAPPKQFADIAKNYLVKQYAQVNSWEDVVDNINSGRPVIVCSNQGFSYTTDSEKMHVARGHWGHCMCIYAHYNSYKIPHGIILNSWGDNIFEQLYDFDTNEKLPPGVIRARAEVIDSMVKYGDSWAISSFDGFPDNSKQITEAMFNFI